MSALIEKNEAYQAIKIIRVDWDQHSESDIVDELGITQRSTLVMFNEGEEVSRLVARTSEKAIGKMFEAATK